MVVVAAAAAAAAAAANRGGIVESLVRVLHKSFLRSSLAGVSYVYRGPVTSNEAPP